ncbi:DUF5319 family protein [Jatrophihabitans sp. YIM 134969]
MTSVDGPRDPFLEDPDDPSIAALLDHFGPGDDRAPVEPLTDAERDGLLADLDAVAEFRRLLSPRGVRGLVVECDDCGDLHYFGWDLMSENLKALLGEGRSHVHEPAFAPDPADYVSWDYARGYVDAVLRR